MKKILLIFTPILFLYALNLEFTEAFMNFKKGLRLIDKNPQKAQIYFEEAYKKLDALKDKPSSQVYYLLGKMYLNGWGTNKNITKAKKYLQLSMKLGNKRAICEIAKLYIKTNQTEKAKKYLQQNKNCRDINYKTLTIKE